MSKYTAKALLARVYQHMGDWEGAREAALDVINNSGFSLVEPGSFAAYWKSPAFRTDRVETLFEVSTDIAGNLGFSMGASGTHPFSHWESQLITDHVRYNEIVNELQEAARSNLIFGLHVHVGMENRKMAIHLANSARYFLPHVYALSTNSPFWEGRKTGYKSFRTKVFDKFPRPGIPEAF